MAITGRIEKDNPVIFFTGNCQAQHLAAIFNNGGLAEAYAIGLDRGFLPSFRGKVAKYVDVEQAALIAKEAAGDGRLVIAAAQMNLNGADETLFSAADRIVQFPHLHAFVFRPSEAGVSSEDPEAIRKLFYHDLKTVDRCQSMAGCKFGYATAIREQFRIRPMFHSHLHPGSYLTSLLVEDIARQIGLEFYEKSRPVIAEILRSEGLNFITDHPVGDITLQTLGCQWPSYDLYRNMIMNDRAGNSEFMLSNRDALVKLFGHETIYLQALMNALSASGKFDEAKEVSRELEYRAPGYVKTWFNRIDVERKSGASDDVIYAILSDADEAFNHNRLALHLRSLVALRIGRPEAGLEAAMRYHSNAPDLSFSVRPLIRILSQLGRDDEAADILRTHCDTLASQERDRLLSALQDVPTILARLTASPATVTTAPKMSRLKIVVERLSSSWGRAIT